MWISRVAGLQEHILTSRQQSGNKEDTNFVRVTQDVPCYFIDNQNILR
jgi:hypothetical protein